MSVLRMSNGSDMSVKLGVAEALKALAKSANDEFVELPCEDGPIHIRPSGVIAVIGEAPRGTAGFRIHHGA